MYDHGSQNQRVHNQESIRNNYQEWELLKLEIRQMIKIDLPVEHSRML